MPGGASNPAAYVSSAFAFPSKDAPAAMLGKPLAALTWADHPLLATINMTTGKPTEHINASANEFRYTDVVPQQANDGVGWKHSEEPPWNS